jgi:hypothetical protein
MDPTIEEREAERLRQVEMDRMKQQKEFQEKIIEVDRQQRDLVTESNRLKNIESDLIEQRSLVDRREREVSEEFDRLKKEKNEFVNLKLIDDENRRKARDEAIALENKNRIERERQEALMRPVIAKKVMISYL